MSPFFPCDLLLPAQKIEHVASADNRRMSHPPLRARQSVLPGSGIGQQFHQRHAFAGQGRGDTHGTVIGHCKPQKFQKILAAKERFISLHRFSGGARIRFVDRKTHRIAIPGYRKKAEWNSRIRHSLMLSPAVRCQLKSSQLRDAEIRNPGTRERKSPSLSLPCLVSCRQRAAKLNSEHHLLPLLVDTGDNSVCRFAEPASEQSDDTEYVLVPSMLAVSGQELKLQSRHLGLNQIYRAGNGFRRAGDGFGQIPESGDNVVKRPNTFDNVVPVDIVAFVIHRASSLGVILVRIHSLYSPRFQFSCE
ncbi:MAG: hypothetical protein MPJ79_01705 [Alphaproteobacteria bacterium]|nr:hypothetical protein [Alphaproteobacteria bacterium]MDA7988388.1 hypothetical protein [Alphaproteobacteria bacterium]MDA8009559.1 hypothetical protein [Alphaproteobacteria bacterium]